MSTDTTANVTPIAETLQALGKTDEPDWGRFALWWICAVLAVAGAAVARVDLSLALIQGAAVAGLLWVGYARRPRLRLLYSVAPLVIGLAMYYEVPMLIAALGMHLHDGSIQHLEHSVFGTQPSRVLASALPSEALSELLHAAYLAFYPAILVPPMLLYARGEWRGMEETVAALTMTMTICWCLFALFPVEGPRYAWGAPAGAIDGPIRRLATTLVAGGSARGTAFPSSHMAISVTQALLALRWQRRVGVGLVVLSLLIGVGAVYGGFHYAVDMITGTLLGVAVSLAVLRRPARRTPVSEL